MARLIAAVVLAVALGGCAGSTSSAWPPPTQAPLKDVWVVRHAWHTRLAVARADVDPSIWPESRELGDVAYLEVGWGDRDYYPSPAPSIWDAVDTIIRFTPAALHVGGYDRSPPEAVPGTPIVRIQVSADGFARLTRFIHDHYVREDGVPVRIGPGPYPRSWFYRARGRYHALANSNNWTLSALQAAGAPVAPWRALTAGHVITQAEAIGERVDDGRPSRRGPFHTPPPSGSQEQHLSPPEEASMGAKHELLSEAEAAYTELRQAVDGIPEARMSDTWLGTWGAREILIHVSGWHREMIPALGRIGRGQSPYPDGVSYDDFDAWNARFVEAKRGVKVADVLAELSASHRDFVAAAAALPEDQLAPGGAARDLFAGTGPLHYREHATQIRQWREASGP